jgi:hypothetical protein
LDFIYLLIYLLVWGFLNEDGCSFEKKEYSFFLDKGAVAPASASIDAHGR